MLYQRMYALGLNMRQRFPEFADESTRRETYRDWPIADIVHPRCLAHAGMFYSGKFCDAVSPGFNLTFCCRVPTGYAMGRCSSDEGIPASKGHFCCSAE